MSHRHEHFIHTEHVIAYSFLLLYEAGLKLVQQGHGMENDILKVAGCGPRSTNH